MYRRQYKKAIELRPGDIVEIESFYNIGLGGLDTKKILIQEPLRIDNLDLHVWVNNERGKPLKIWHSTDIVCYRKSERTKENGN